MKTEDNILIGVFIGDLQSKDSKVSFTKSCSVEELKYHSSWNWLMPVVQKCLTVGDNTDQWDNILNELQTVNIEATYKAVVQFIKWYNKQKQ